MTEKIRLQADYAETERLWMAEEEKVRQRIGPDGKRWRKAYFGGGEHYRNWLAQYIEVCGEENIQVEEIEACGLQCYKETGEKMYRIWVREKGAGEKVKS